MKESSSESFSAGANIIEEAVAPFDPASEMTKPLPTPENPTIDLDAAAGYAETILELSKRGNITNERKLFDAFVSEFQMQDNLPQARAAFGLGIKLVKAEGGFGISAASRSKQKAANPKPAPKTPFLQTEMGQDMEKVFVEREKALDKQEKEQASRLSKFFRGVLKIFTPKKSTEIVPPPAKYLPGMSVSVFRNGKMLNNLMITDMDSSGKFFFKDPETGEDFERTFADIEMWNNQLSEDSVKKANNMQELLDIVAKSGGVMGSSQYYTADYLSKALMNVRDNRGRLSDVTKSAGLREKVYELMTSEFSAQYDDTEFGNRID